MIGRGPGGCGEAGIQVNSYSDDIDFSHGTNVAKIMIRTFPGECANRVPHFVGLARAARYTACTCWSSFDMSVQWIHEEVDDEPVWSALITLLPGASKGPAYGPATVGGGGPRGRHHIRVCRAVACHVKGSEAVLAALQDTLGILPGEVTADGQFSLEVVACLDACGMAPVVAVNEELFPGVTPHQVERLIRDLAAE